MKILAIVLTGIFAGLTVAHLKEQPQSLPLESVNREDVRQPHQAAPSSGIRLRECSQELERGRAWLQTTPAYTATFHKQERIGGELQDKNTIELKLRHEPFSVMMRWLDEGRVVYYQDGSNDNRMTVKMGGWKGRLGWIKLDPDSSLALSESRYPVTQVGLTGLIDELLRQWEPYNDRTDGVDCEWLDNGVVDGRPCRIFRVTYASPDVFAEYRQSTVWLDQEHCVPLQVKNYDWCRDEPGNPNGLVEHYIYEDVDFHARLAEADFQVPGAKASRSQAALNTESE